jgi:hypothetical protein
MHPIRTLAGAAALALVFAGPLQAEERVQGAELIKPGAAVEQLYPKLIPMPFTQSEIDLFLKESPGVVSWAKEHKTQWNAVDQADDTFEAIGALAVWDTVDLTSGEFIALVIKLKICQELTSGNLDVNMLKQQFAFMQQMMNDPNLPPASKAELQKNLGALESMIKGFETYPEDNKATYASNKEKVDEALASVEALDDENGAGAPAPPAKDAADAEKADAPDDAGKAEAPKGEDG